MQQRLPPPYIVTIDTSKIPDKSALPFYLSVLRLHKPVTAAAQVATETQHARAIEVL